MQLVSWRISTCKTIYWSEQYPYFWQHPQFCPSRKLRSVAIRVLLYGVTRPTFTMYMWNVSGIITPGLQLPIHQHYFVVPGPVSRIPPCHEHSILDIVRRASGAVKSDYWDVQEVGRINTEAVNLASSSIPYCFCLTLSRPPFSDILLLASRIGLGKKDRQNGFRHTCHNTVFCYTKSSALRNTTDLTMEEEQVIPAQVSRATTVAYLAQRP